MLFVDLSSKRAFTSKTLARACGVDIEKAAKIEIDLADSKVVYQCIFNNQRPIYYVKAEALLAHALVSNPIRIIIFPIVQSDSGKNYDCQLVSA